MSAMAFDERTKRLEPRLKKTDGLAQVIVHKQPAQTVGHQVRLFMALYRTVYFCHESGAA